MTVDSCRRVRANQEFPKPDFSCEEVGCDHISYEDDIYFNNLGTLVRGVCGLTRKYFTFYDLQLKS